jgi:hypothetical protein
MVELIGSNKQAEQREIFLAFQWTENARATCQRWHDERIAALKAAEAQARVDREQLEKQLQREQTKRLAFGFEHA